MTLFSQIVFGLLLLVGFVTRAFGIARHWHRHHWQLGDVTLNPDATSEDVDQLLASLRIPNADLLLARFKGWLSTVGITINHDQSMFDGMPDGVAAMADPETRQLWIRDQQISASATLYFLLHETAHLLKDRRLDLFEGMLRRLGIASPGVIWGEMIAELSVILTFRQLSIPNTLPIAYLSRQLNWAEESGIPRDMLASLYADTIKAAEDNARQFVSAVSHPPVPQPSQASLALPHYDPHDIAFPQPEIETLAKEMVGDGKNPNWFFVSAEGVIVTVTRDFDVAYENFNSLAHAMHRRECALEDRKTGVICCVEPAVEGASVLVLHDDAHYFGYRR